MFADGSPLNSVLRTSRHAKGFKFQCPTLGKTVYVDPSLRVSHEHDASVADAPALASAVPLRQVSECSQDSSERPRGFEARDGQATEYSCVDQVKQAINQLVINSYIHWLRSILHCQPQNNANER